MINFNLGDTEINFSKRYAKKNFVPTPFEELNKRLHGGIKGGEIAAVLAPSGRGKSTFLLNQALVAARYFQFQKNESNVFYFLLEMSAEEQQERLVQCINRLQTQELLERKSFRIPKMPLVLVDSLEFPNSIQGISEYVDSVTDIKPGLIIVDYAANLDEVIGEGWTAYKRVSKQLENLAQKHKCVVWTGSQVTRPMDFDEEKMLYGEAHIEGGKSLRNSMSLFISLNQTKVEREKNLIKVNPFKCRRGNTDPFIAYYDNTTFYMGDLKDKEERNENIISG